MSPIVSVIIVSFNTRSDTVKAIRSVLSSDGFGRTQLEVILVDNHSTDDTVSYVQSHLDGVKIIANQTNRGFGGGNNQGAKLASGQYLLFLNSDAYLGQNSLKIMLDELRDQHDVIAVGPKLIYQNGDSQPSAGYLPTPSRVMAWMWGLDKLPLIKRWFSQPYHLFDLSWYEHDQTPDWLMGACLLFRRSEFLSVGGFDENIFMYSEEVELFQRLKVQLGKLTLYTSKTTVTHVGSVSTKKAAASRLVYEIQGIFYIYKKYYPQLLWFITFVIYTGVMMRLIVFSLMPSKQGSVAEYKKLFRVK